MSTIGTALLIIALTATGVQTQERFPVIDMHLHAGPAGDQGPPPVSICAPIEHWPTRDAAWTAAEYASQLREHANCAAPLVSPMTDDALMDRTLEVLARRNIYAVTSGAWYWVQRWRAAAPERIIPALGFHVYNAPLDSVRTLIETGQLAVLGEVMNQFIGLAPNDTIFEPYLALAEEHDVPVGIHMGPGPPGAPYRGAEGYRAALARPLLLEEVLIRHPRLRIYIMHAGWPMLDEIMVLLYTHPQVYVDLGLLGFAVPRAEFYGYLQRLVQAGFGKRVMFGSDQMLWPDAIEVAIDAIESAPFLDEEQRRDILYHNAARFLRLTEDEIARHHGR